MEPQEATIYKGQEGIKSIADDVIATRKPIFVFGTQENFMKLFTHYAEQWHRRRGKYHIPIKIIYNEKVRPIRTNLPYPLMQGRFNSTVYGAPSTTWIYGDKVAITVWSDQPLATVIRSRSVAKSYRQFFDVLWKDSKL